MRLANLEGRAVLVTGDGNAVDIETASAGAFGPELPAIFLDWDEFRVWVEEQEFPDGAGTLIDRSLLGPPSPLPRQIVAVGLNYRDHAIEAGMPIPDGLPPIFTKFASSLTGPQTTVQLPPGGNADWEVELVVVIGRRADYVKESDAWSHVAGLTVGQDLSERKSQLAGGGAPQFSMAKSFRGFAPTGPWLVTVDEFDDPDDLELGCRIDGELVQKARSLDLIYSVPRLIEAVSAQLTLFPGDLMFTGTPAGVGMGRSPQRFLQDGEVLSSWIEGIGELEQTFVAGS